MALCPAWGRDYVLQLKDHAAAGFGAVFLLVFSLGWPQSLSKARDGAGCSGLLKAPPAA